MLENWPVAEPFIGYRSFSVNEGTLVGHYGHVWEGPELTAECERAGMSAVVKSLTIDGKRYPIVDPVPMRAAAIHEPPAESCKCGIYAHKSPLKVDQYARNIIAECSMWGTIIDGDMGYRAQHARIKRLWLVADETEWNTHVASFLSTKYGVPCVIGDRDRFLKDTNSYETYVGKEQVKATANMLNPTVYTDYSGWFYASGGNVWYQKMYEALTINGESNYVYVSHEPKPKAQWKQKPHERQRPTQMTHGSKKRRK